MKKNNLYNYTNLSPTYEKAVVPLEDNFYLSSIVSMLLGSDDPKICRVGSYSKSVGWTCQSQKQKKSDDVVRPLNTKLTPMDGYYFRLLTKVSNETFRENIESHPLK